MIVDVKPKYLGNMYGLHDGYDGSVFDPNGISKTITRSIGGIADVVDTKEYRETSEKSTKDGTNESLEKCTWVIDGVKYLIRIRKLTPKECWRLMGFDDDDFERAAAVNSNTQLYKQAGNSIVVDVLENIFREMM